MIAVLIIVLIVAGSIRADGSLNLDLLAFPETEIRLGQNAISHSAAWALANKKSSQYVIVGVPSGNELLSHKKYLLCELPTAKDVSRAEPALGSSQSAQQAPQDRGSYLEQANAVLDKMPCIYRQNHWWTYEVCRNAHVRQFHVHQDNKQPMTEYFLGRFRSDADTKLFISDVASEQDRVSIVQIFDRGDKCELTGAPRSVKVKYLCFPHFDDRIASIQEVATCEYLVTVHTSRLCQVAAFMPQPPPPVDRVVCQPISLDTNSSTTFTKNKAAEMPLAAAVFQKANFPAHKEPSLPAPPKDQARVQTKLEALFGGKLSSQLFEIKFNSDGSISNAEQVRNLLEGAMKQVAANADTDDPEANDDLTNVVERLVGKLQEPQVDKEAPEAIKKPIESRQTADASERLLEAMKEAQVLLEGMPEAEFAQARELARVFYNRQVELRKPETTATLPDDAKPTPAVVPKAVQMLREHLESVFASLSSQETEAVAESSDADFETAGNEEKKHTSDEL